MAVNDLSFNQLATVLNSIQNQATGKTNLTATTTSDFVSIAQATLKTGYDPCLSAISQVLSKTIFANRPYSARFGGIRVDNQRYGAITRKLNICDKAFEEDDRIKLVDGQSIDMYKVNKPSVLQTNYYGQNVYQKSLTIFKDQLDVAFSGAEEFGSFISMVMTNASDMIEQAHEETARATLCNFMAGKYRYHNNTEHVVHLLTEYNAKTGLSLTSTTVYQPANFKPFMQWVYARIAEISSLMTERSYLYHKNVNHFGGTYDEQSGTYSGGEDKSFVRHTPYDKQKVYLRTPIRFEVEAQVLADTYHDNYLKLANVETVNFWQSIKSPANINVTPIWLDDAGKNLTPNAPVNEGGFFGVIFDEDALGYTVVNEWSGTTPMNVRGGYSNIYYHFTDRYWNDATENGVVLMLD